MRALRLLHGDVPDVPAARRRARRSARAHLPHQAGARRRAGHGEDAAAPRPLPHLPQLRDDVPVGRASTDACSTSAATSSTSASGARRRSRRCAGRCARGLLAKPLFGGALARGPRGEVAAAARARAPVPDARAGGRLARRRGIARKMLALEGCVQPSLAPNIDAAMARVLDRIGISLVRGGGGCCGALPYHLTSTTRRVALAKRNIDAWWPHVERGAEAIVVTASGCGVMVKDYGHLLRVGSAVCATRRSASPRSRAIRSRSSAPNGAASRRRSRWTTARRRVAFHPPCTLQHGMKLRGRVEEILLALGLELDTGGRRAPVLRLGRHLFDPAARAREPAARRTSWPRSRRAAPTSSPPPTSAA